MRLALAPFLLAATLLADDPPPKPSDGTTLTAVKPVTVDLGKKCVITVETSAKKVTWKVPAEVEFLALDGKRIACWALPGSYTLHAMVPAGDDVLSTEINLTVLGPRPPPTKLELIASASTGQIPFTVTFTAVGDSTDGVLDFGDGTTTKVLPAAHVYLTAGDYTASIKTVSESASVKIKATAGPTPEPPPGPVTKFLVMFVYESADTLTPSERGVVFGKTVEDYLTANCTGGKAGWRRRDKDAAGEGDPNMKSMWAAVQPEFLPPKNTKTPAVAIQVNDSANPNGKVYIESLPRTAAEAVTLLKKYGGK